MVELLLTIDRLITQTVYNLLPHNSFFDLFFSFFSLQGISVLIWIILLASAIILEERKNPGISSRDKKFILYFTISFLTTAFIVNVVIKNIVQRPRPAFAKATAGKPVFTDSDCSSDYSFPSGHASTSLSAASILAAFDKRRKYFYYVVAGLIAFSRIYLGCHYFLDIIFGAMIGYGMSKFILIINPIGIFFPKRRRY